MAKQVQFGTAKAIKSVAPRWANLAFYIILGTFTAVSTWLYSTNLVDADLKPEIQLIITVLTPLFYGLKKMLGVVDK